MKLLVKTVASTAVVLVTLAGCASRSSGDSHSAAAGPGSDVTSSTSPGGTTSTENSEPPSAAPGGPTTGTSSGSQPIAPSSPGGSSSSSPAKPDPSAQVKYVSPQGVTLASDGVTLIAEVTWGGCSDQPQLVVMSQDASKVVVELKETSHARIGVMCPDIARNGEASVKLVAPLGTRQVIDGIKNAPINVH
ncbi:hypothetical protein GCM10009839_21230 [Catenulispora yoronensis]|uniref:Lipoprotein n=1 Tax=Catenulispora yoronensis TaxID=450799 RepID=A0ABP5FC65_9ACTN